jgi:hypothetical protein
MNHYENALRGFIEPLKEIDQNVREVVRRAKESEPEEDLRDYTGDYLKQLWGG